MENYNVNVDYILERINFSDTIVLSKDRQSYTCGRGRNNMIICLSLTVSRSHCMFIRTNDGLSVIDLASSNGLYVNGEPQSPHTLVRLSENDIIGIGCPDVDTTNSSMFVYKLRIPKPKPSVSLPSECNSGILSRTFVNQNNSKSSDELKMNKEPKSTTNENFHDKRKLSLDNGKPRLPPKVAKLQSQKASSSTAHCTAGEQSDNTFENKISDINVRRSSSEMKEVDDVQILSHCSDTLKNKELHENESSCVNQSELTSIEKENRLNNLLEHSRNIVDTVAMEGCNVSSSFPKKDVQQSSNSINVQVPLSINRPECSRTIKVSKEKSQLDVQFDGDNINSPVKNNTRSVNSDNDKIVQMVQGRCEDELEFNCNLHNGVSRTDKMVFRNKKLLNKNQPSKSTEQIAVNNVNMNQPNVKTNHEVTKSYKNLRLTTRNAETVLDKASNSFRCTGISASGAQNANLEKDNVCRTLTAVTLEEKTEDPFEISIKMEVDSQANGSVEEITSPRLMCSELISKSSPIKLRQIKQEPTTSFSENDIVNLSDDEDNIFPCSQLFDVIIDPEWEIKQETKEQICEEHDNDMFHGPDETEVILLSDSEDEDNPWLERLSKSQILNETESIAKTEKIDHDFVDLVEVSEDILDSPAMLGTLEIQEKRVVDSVKESKDDESHEEPIDIHTIGTSINTISDNIPCETRFTAANVQSNAAEKKKTSSSKSVSSKRVPQIIEPPFLPKGERQRTGYTVQKSDNREATTSTSKSNVLESDATSKTKSKLRLTTKQKKELEQKSKVDQNVYMKEQKIRHMKYKWAECLPVTNKVKSRSLSKEKKLEIINNRREKLKKIAEEQKSAAENIPVTKRAAAKAKVKISLKSRSDFLIDEQQLLSKQCTSSNQTVPGNTTTTAESSTVDRTKKLKDGGKSAGNNVSVKKQSSTSKKRIDVKQDLTPGNSISKAVENITENLQESLSFKKTTESSRATTSNSNALGVHKARDPVKICRKSKSVTAVTKSDVPIVNSSSMVISNVRSEVDKCSPNMRNGKQLPQNMKKVRFSENLLSVHTYEIDPGCKLKKIVGKDAPIPNDKLPVKSKSMPYPKLEEFLLHIFKWNPVWLEEQLHLKTDPPVVNSDILHPMKLCYDSYQEYCKTAIPLLLLELWYQITKDFENIDKNSKRVTLMCSITNSSLTLSTIPSTNLYVTNITLEVLITKEHSQRQAHPTYGDLVFLELATIENGKQKFHKVFAYVTNVKHTVLTSCDTFYNQELVQYVRNPHALLTYTVITKPLQLNVQVNRPMRLRSVSNLRSNMRMVQALRYLPLSPLINSILYPKTEDYQLPNVSDLQNCSLITKENLNEKQLEAVLTITKSIVQKEAKICLIKGPPGTGKSKVILNIITQVLYGNNRYKNNRAPLRILVCAPSNAAIDEIALRLLAIRGTIEKQNRFKMVRVGRSEVIHPVVKNISVSEIAKRDVKRTTSNYLSSDVAVDLEEDKRVLEARINALKCELESSQCKGDNSARNIKMKLADVTAKYDLLQNRKKIDEMSSTEFSKLMRAAENKVLERADIIACTLSSCYTNQMEYIFGGKLQRISVCIVDEATQSYEAETLIPLMLGVNTLVLVGDPNQLPATVLSQRAKILGLGQSLFARLQNVFEGQQNNPIIMLNTQYRMASPIAYWPNKYFYAGKLKTVINSHFVLPFHSYRVMNLDSCQNNDKFSNTKEAEFVINLIVCMTSYIKLITFDRIITMSVITPYNKQKLLMQTRINERMPLISDIIGNKMVIEVNTIDNFQGQERDIVIMSCVRSQGIGFLSDHQRLCVALTRAKQCLILCGNFTTFQRDQMWNALLSDARLRRVYIDISADAKLDTILTHVAK